MVATKTNERPGTRAQMKYVRSSAYKVREVLNLIRGKSFAEATDILMFSERRISETVQKCLDSAAANAENNDNIPIEELYISACYADEGPTLKRWRPRARGRATRIRKRTCHITIILGRYTPDELEEIREQASLKGSDNQPSATEARRRRVEKSKQSDTDEIIEETEVIDESAVEADESEISSEEGRSEADSGSEDQPFGVGSVNALEDGSSPGDEYVIKGKSSTKIYHPQESSFYGRTKADVWFTSAEVAEAAGFRLPSNMQKKSEEEAETDQVEDTNEEENK